MYPYRFVQGARFAHTGWLRVGIRIQVLVDVTFSLCVRCVFRAFVAMILLHLLLDASELSFERLIP